MNMIIKCKISKYLLGKSETVILFNKQTVLLEYISFATNILLEYFNIDVRNFYIGISISGYKNYINTIASFPVKISQKF